MLTGMGFRPMIKIDSTLIEFKTGEKKTYEKHLENMEELLKRMSSCFIR